MTVTTPALRVAFELACRFPARTVAARPVVVVKEHQGRPSPQDSALLRAKILALQDLPTYRAIADAVGCSAPTVRRHLGPRFHKGAR